MRSLAMTMSRSAFFIGCLIGLFLTSTFPLATQACARPSMEYDPPPPTTEQDYLNWSGVGYSDWTTPMQEAWSHMEAANKQLCSTAFGAAHQPGLFYRVSDPVDGPGVYDATARDGTTFTLVVFFSSEPVTHMSNGKALEGEGSGRLFYGEVQGPEGDVGVRGLIAATTRAGGVRDQMVLIDDVLTADQTQTWRSTGLIMIAGKDADVTTANETAFMAANGQTQSATRNCLKPDLLTVIVCVAAVTAALVLCQQLGMAAVVAALIQCATLLSIPFFGWAAAAICVAAVIALRAAAIAACLAAFTAAMRRCLMDWGADILNCKLEQLVNW